MRRSVFTFATLSLMASIAAGCSSMPDVEDVVDLNFESEPPDERQVRVHQVLAMPPDYSLRAPADGTLPADQEGQANPYALPTLQENADLLVQSPGVNEEVTSDTASDTVVANADPNAEGPQSLSPGDQQQTSQEQQWPHGINPNHPDGTPKSQNEINEEMRQRRAEQERAENPSYGTIFNIGALFE